VLLSWCAGRTVLEELAVRPWQARCLGVLIGRTLAAIHRIPAPAVPRQRRDSWLDWAGPDDEPLRRRLRELARHGDDTALLHLDYHQLNIMTDGTRITGVLDWENARAGDPRADLARTVSILLVDARGPHGPSSAERRMRLALARGCLGGYAEVAGVPAEMARFMPGPVRSCNATSLPSARPPSWRASATGPTREDAARAYWATDSTSIFTPRTQ